MSKKANRTPSEMSSKDKDTKTMEKLLKQFFKFQKGSSSVGTKFRDDFVLKPEYERDLSSEASLVTRIKTLKDLFEVVVVSHLDESVVAKLWLLLQDLLGDGVTRENRHMTFSFFSTIIQGQHDKLGIMRAQFFKVIKNHKNSEDFVPRMNLLQSLTDNGKDILHFEEEIGPFLLDFMHDAVQEGQDQDFLQILINVIKYNASYIDEDIINDIVESICALCCQSNSEKVVMSCLHVLDAIVCYSELPTESLCSFICTLCRTVNLEIYCPTSWKIMRNLMGTHLGYSSLWTMKCILSEPSSLNEPGLLRGAVFYISMSLWSNSEVAKLNATPGSILPSFLAAVKCEQVLVMYEIVLAIYHLICKHEKELFHPVWTVIFDIMKFVLPHTMKTTDDEATAMLNKLFHETLTYVEELDQNGALHGCVDTLYSLISDCSSYRPEISVKRLIDHMARSITPVYAGWLDQLDSLLTRFYNEEVSIKIRVKVLSMFTVIMSHNRFLYEKELVGLALNHLKNVHNEPDLIVRKSGTELLVNLFLNSAPEQALELLDLLDKILNRALERKEKVREEDAEDIKKTAHGLVRGLASSMFQYPSTVAISTFKLIANHLNRHYESPEYLNQVTSIRHMMLECLLRLRADEYYRVGLLGEEPGYSLFLRAHDPPSYKRVEVPPATMLLSSNPLMPDDHVRLALSTDIKTELESSVAAGGASESFEIITVDVETVFPVALATRAIVGALYRETDWKIMLMLLKEIPLLLKNRALFVSDTEQFRQRPNSEVDLVAKAICAMICDKSLNLPDRLVNTPPRFTTSDFQHYVFPVLASLIPYHTHLETTYHQRIIKCLECGVTSKCANLCVSALLICTLEMRDAMVKLLPEVLLCLSKISATVLIAVPILEFLSTLTQLPKLFANFVSDQYMSVFAIALPYTNPFKYNHYTVSLAHHVIAAWFLKCRLPFRRDFGKFITKGLKANILLPFEEGRMINREEMINEDSSNRKRSSSLTEQGSRRRQTVSPRLDLKPPIDNTLLSFHKELTETCIDLMAMYAYSTCSPFPKRQSTAERILNGGRSMTWLVGHKLITVTTSGCNLKALKQGLCDKCYRDCRVQTGSSLSKEGSEDKKSKSENISTESNASSSSPPSPEEEKSASMEPEQSKIDQLIYGKHQEHQVCCCWCKGWSEIVIQRPTGSMSWSMRLQNEPHSAHLKDWKDHGNADISTLFLSYSDSKNFDEMKTRERALERVGSDPVSIPQSPIKRYSGHDDDYDECEEGGRGNLNPVRRTNSSPDVTSNAKNPLLMPEPPELDLGESSKKISFPKDMRGNCEAIPEEMGTTPPTTEAVLLAPHHGQLLTTTLQLTLDTKPPVPTSSSTVTLSSRHAQMSHGSKDSSDGDPTTHDTASLPPLKYKRDRGHTISVMSPARKTGREWDLSAAVKNSKPKESNRSTSGVNPAFVFLQLYHSPYFGCNHEKPILVPSETAQTIKHLSWIPPYEVHKIGVLYVGPGQSNSEVDILQNEYGSPRYIEFLQRLGTLINLDDADKQEIFLGGLGAGDGKFSYIWQDDVMQVIFHVATLMPNMKNDPKSTTKKSHIGNDFTTIVYNDSGEEYNLQTISGQFNYAAIVIEPLEHGTNQIKVKCKEELASLMYHTDYKVISDQSVSILARQLALHCNLAAIVMSRKKNQPPYASNWLERLRHIKRIHNRLVEDGSGPRVAQTAGHHTSEAPTHHFTNHIHDFTEYT